MRSVCKRRGGTLCAALFGELDQHSADELRKKLDGLLEGSDVSRIEFDLTGVTFMDSSGVGVILGRYRKLKERKGSMDVTGAGANVERVLRMSGVYKLCTKGGKYEQ